MEQQVKSSDMGIRALVEQWWADVLKEGTQVMNPESVHDNTVAADVNGRGWYGKVDTDTLFNDFLLWCTDKGVAPISKQAFTNVLYSVTGARRGRSRRNQEKGSMVYVAVFNRLEDHQPEVPLDTAAGL